MTHERVAPARKYLDSYGIFPVGTDLGYFGGGTTDVRTRLVWQDAESIEQDAKFRVKLIRRVIAQMIETETRRLASVGLIARRFRKPVPRQFALTASLVLSMDSDDPDAGEKLLVEFDLLSSSSVDEALERYRQFVIDSTTAALHVEQALARENSTGFWAGWEGA